VGTVGSGAVTVGFGAGTLALPEGLTGSAVGIGSVAEVGDVGEDGSVE
jgi:hypothetical protein